MKKLADLKNRVHHFFINHQTLSYVLIILIISLFEIRLINTPINLLYKEGLWDCSNAAEGIIRGTPQWRATQNRILGPAVVSLISNITGLTFFNSYLIVIWSLLIFANVLSFKIFLTLTKDKKIALNYSFLFAVLFLFIQDVRCVYIWDFIDLIVFILFAYGVFNKIKLRYLVILFLVCLLNKESALFISLWIFMDSFNFNNPKYIHSKETFKRKIVNYPKLTLSIFLTIGGVIYTKLIRDALFIQSMIPFIGYDLKHAVWGQHFQVIYNIKMLIRIFVRFKTTEFVIPIILFVVPLYLLYKMKANEFSIKVMLLFLVMLVSIFVFGFILETRVYCILIPFALMLKLYFDNKIVFSHY